MAINTSTNTDVIRQQVYSQFLIENLEEIMLPEGLARDVSDFGDGDTLNIPTVGTVALQEAAENTPLTFNPIDTGRVQLTISNYPGDAWYITDDMLEDAYLAERLMMERTMEASRAMAQKFETDFLQTCEDAMVAQGDAVSINGVAHRITAGAVGGTNRVMDVEDFAFMKFAFDKANVPDVGRIAIVDPIVELTLNKLYNTTYQTNANAQVQSIITEGWARSHKFVMNLFGFDIWTSNRLPVVAAQDTIENAGGTSDNCEVGDVANLFMCVADDQCKPVMKAWRRQPKVESWRDPETRSEKHQTTARYGLGVQRLDTLGVIYTNPTASVAA